MRWPMAWWQLLFAGKRDFAAPAGANEMVTRGAYLVEGPGHCGACHTPRGLAYQEKALSMACLLYTSRASPGSATASAPNWRWK